MITGCGNAGSGLGSEAQSDWATITANSAMDGDKIIVSKEFRFPEKMSVIRASLQCKQMSKDLSISLESYALGNGSTLPGSAFISTGFGTIVGRVKFRDHAPTPLGDAFKTDKYSNVISWNVRVAALDARAALRRAREDLANVNSLSNAEEEEQSLRNAGIPDHNEEVAGATVAAYGSESGSKYLRVRLPLAIEVNNQGGTEEVVIPSNNTRIAELLDACSAPEPKKGRPSPSAQKVVPRSATPIAVSSDSRDPNKQLAGWAAQIQSRVQRAWLRPPSAGPGISCTVFVTQNRGGEVVKARVGECNGDAAVRGSIKAAAFRASPLPAPPDPNLFNPDLEIQFKPTD